MRFLLAVLSALALLSARAQALELRFLLVGGETLVKDFWLVHGGGNQVPVLTNGVVAFPAARADNAVQLRVLDKSKPDAKPVDFSVPVDPSVAKGLVLLLPDTKAPGGIRGEAFPYDPATFAKGGFRILNASGREWTFDLGGERWLLPVRRKPLDLTPAGDRVIVVKIATLKEPQAPRMTSVWPLKPDVCSLVVLTPENGPAAAPEVTTFEFAPERAGP